MDILYTVKHIINNDYFIFTGAINETIVFSIPDFVPGVSYSLTVSGTDGDEQTDTEVVEFEIIGIMYLLEYVILCTHTQIYTNVDLCHAVLLSSHGREYCLLCNGDVLI